MFGKVSVRREEGSVHFKGIRFLSVFSCERVLVGVANGRSVNIKELHTL